GAVRYHWRLLVTRGGLHSAHGVLSGQQHYVLVLELGHLPVFWRCPSRRASTGLGALVIRVQPDNSLKPNLLRYTKAISLVASVRRAPIHDQDGRSLSARAVTLSRDTRQDSICPA